MTVPKRKHRRSILFLFIGPSGVGKSTILKAILRKKSLRLRRVITTTTRSPRPGEVREFSYSFVNDKKFDDLIRRGELLEWARVQTSRYGTPKHPTVDLLSRGQNMILHIDVQGADALAKQKGLNTTSIFVAPASLGELKKRLAKRHYLGSHEREVRWQTALKEMKRMTDFDFRVVNVDGHVQEAIREVEEIIRAVR